MDIGFNPRHQSCYFANKIFLWDVIMSAFLWTIALTNRYFREIQLLVVSYASVYAHRYSCVGYRCMCLHTVCHLTSATASPAVCYMCSCTNDCPWLSAVAFMNGIVQYCPCYCLWHHVSTVSVHAVKCACGVMDISAAAALWVLHNRLSSASSCRLPRIK